MTHNFRYLLSVLTVLFFSDIQLFKFEKKKIKIHQTEKKSIFKKQLLFNHLTKKKKIRYTYLAQIHERQII